MKICLLFILAFGGFHLWCCWSASFTAKPAFRAHFAATPIWFPYGRWQHPTLIAIGSVMIAFMALSSAWACGAFCLDGLLLAHRLWIWGFWTTGFLITLGAVLANQQAVYRLKTFDPNRNDRKRDNRKRYFILDWKSQPLQRSVAGFLIAIALFGVVILFLELALDFENRLRTYWRSMNLNSGVSPLLPFLVLFGGVYLWFWYSLHGLALFGMDRPRLPAEYRLLVRNGDQHVPNNSSGDSSWSLRMFSQEKARGTERVAVPLERPTCAVAVVILVIFTVVAFGTAWGVPLRSLGANAYGIFFFLFFAFCVSWTLAETWQFLRVWRGLKQLLSFLDRIALRRTMSALQGFSWGNV